MSKLHKVLKISILTITILVVLVIGFISPLSKFLLEKYDKKYIGREIKTDWVFVNPFTGFLYIKNLEIFELNSDTIFFSAKGLSANIEMSRLLSKSYLITEITLEQPKGLVFQNRERFNFSDLIAKFSTEKDSTKEKEPLQLSILNIKIYNGEFHYHEIVTPIVYHIKNVSIESAGYRWNVDTIPVKFSFLSGLGSGDMKGDFTVNSKNKDYKLAIQIHDFDLNIVGQYIKDLTNFGSFKAWLNADFNSIGNLVDRGDVSNSGLISINDFHFGKDSLTDFAAFENLTISINKISPKRFIYNFDSVSIKHPYFKYEKYDYLDNVQRMFGVNGANLKAANAKDAKFNLVIEIAKYLKIVSRNLFHSNYKLGRVAIYKGEIVYNDYSLGEKFGIAIQPFSFIANSIDKTHKRLKFNLGSNIKPYGSFALDISINPKDSTDFELKYWVQKVPISLFNSYLIKYTSFPLDRGTIEVKGNWVVRNGQINSINHLVIIDPRIGEKLKNENANWLPLNLAMFFVREKGNVIDYEVPILGDLNNPNFKLKDAVEDALVNIFVKPVSTPYRTVVRNTETKVEKSLSLKWEMRNCKLTSPQEKFLEKLSVFLHQNPEASVIIYPQIYEKKEKEYILFFEAKKKYVLKCMNKDFRSFNKNDSARVEKLSIKNSLFLNCLNQMVSDPMLFTVQEKCMKLIGKTLMDKKFNALNKARVDAFSAYFRANENPKRVKFMSSENVIPYNGFSFFKIAYKGVFPDYLINAYIKMNELNNEAPRDKFKLMRKKIGSQNLVL